MPYVDTAPGGTKKQGPKKKHFKLFLYCPYLLSRFLIQAIDSFMVYPK